jgi:hypothetical protein
VPLDQELFGEDLLVIEQLQKGSGELTLVWVLPHEVQNDGLHQVLDP